MPTLQKTIAPYGSWKSPVSADLIASASIGLSDIALDGPHTYWIESRPTEGGRNVLVRNGVDVTPPPFNVRSKVHEYGGGAYLAADGTCWFVNFTDQQIYVAHDSQSPSQLTRSTAMRYADLVLDANRQRLICVREDHSGGTVESVTNTIASVSLSDGAEQVLQSGRDFYASPRLCPSGSQLCWLVWDLPAMPWDGTELWVADVVDGGLQNPRLVAGGPSESVFQPTWSPDGVLHFVSDKSGWWNLYRLIEGRPQPLCAMDAEFGLPQWVFGMSTYAFASDRRLVCTYNQEGIWHLGMLEGEALHPIECPYTDISGVRAAAGKAVLLAASPTESSAVVEMDLDTRAFRVLRKSTDLTVDSAYWSVPRAIEFPTSGGQSAHAFLYPPHNPDFQAPAGELPPLLVLSHGGPHGAVTARLSLKIQFWTSRGFTVVDVNYGGSTGYGRPYRERLRHQWGVVDVDDCANVASYLASQQQVDGARLIITGGSAGGYTTLSALTFRDVFKAGASHYGICDIEVLEQDTHKFESQYGRSLIGPYPERRDLYYERSPIHFTERLNCPLILFQGLEDVVVPPRQAEIMFDAVKAKGLPVAYLPFAGEQHGFRRSENIKRALEGELYFYSRVFGFELADAIEPVPIENL